MNHIFQWSIQCCGWSFAEVPRSTTKSTPNFINEVVEWLSHLTVRLSRLHAWWALLKFWYACPNTDISIRFTSLWSGPYDFNLESKCLHFWHDISDPTLLQCIQESTSSNIYVPSHELCFIIKIWPSTSNRLNRKKLTLGIQSLTLLFWKGTSKAINRAFGSVLWDTNDAIKPLELCWTSWMLKLCV